MSELWAAPGPPTWNSGKGDLSWSWWHAQEGQQSKPGPLILSWGGS